MGRHGIERRPHLAQHLESRGGLPLGRRTTEGPVHTPRDEARALGVEGDEVERCRSLRAVGEEASEKLIARAPGAKIACGGGAADGRVGKGGLHGRRRHVVERVELLRRAAPVGESGSFHSSHSHPRTCVAP